VIVGIPTEVKTHEYRVAATPEGVRELVHAGHEVVVQADAGAGSAITDDDFVTAGARIVPDADAVFAAAGLIVKVKEPQPEEYERFRSDHVLFTYLHLAADPTLTSFLVERGVRAIAYETVQTPDGKLPLLAPMSEIAGRMAPQEGAKYLERPSGGRGVLMGGASGVRPALVVVLGGGMAGWNAAEIAAGMQAEVVVVDKNVERLREIDQIWRGRIQTVMSSRLAVERLVVDADLVIGAVLVPGAKAPHLVTAQMVKEMRPGAVIEYDLSLLGVRFGWRTLIERFEPPERFVDVQARGPYRSWRHTHEFEEVPGGTRIVDRVEYELPFGPLGGLAHRLFVARQLRAIFDYRRRVIAEIFG